MYALLKDAALRVMKAPTEPPDPPAGSHGAVDVYRASPKYLSYRLLGFWVVFTMLWLVTWGMVVSGSLLGEESLLVIGIVLAAALAVVQFFFYFAIRIDYDMRYYIATDRSLRIREGAFIVKEKTITFANVQNLRVVQGPLLRLFGIWHLRVDTAGGGASKKGEPEKMGHRVQMAGIVNAHAVRDEIRRHLLRRGTSAGLGDLDDRDDDSTGAPALGTEFIEALRELKLATSALRESVAKTTRR